jgi:hypothetical protein
MRTRALALLLLLLSVSLQAQWVNEPSKGIPRAPDANNAFGIRTLNVTLSGGQLLVDFNGKGRIPLVALSERMFSPRLLGTYEFVVDDRGAVTHLLAHGVEGSPRAVRRQ